MEKINFRFYKAPSGGRSKPRPLGVDSLRMADSATRMPDELPRMPPAPGSKLTKGNVMEVKELGYS